MRANHNLTLLIVGCATVVSNVSKILKWEQITTMWEKQSDIWSCFQCFKDTKMRANHNVLTSSNPNYSVVSNVSKILKWEQITT